MEFVENMYNVLFLLSMMSLLNGFLVHHNDLCGTLKVECTCRIGENDRNITLELRKYLSEDPMTENKSCFGIRNPYEVCASYGCSLTAVSDLHLDASDSGALLDDFNTALEKFTIARGESHRFTRKTDPCHVQSLKNGDVTCWKWTNYINCNIKCIHGHAFDGINGTVKSINVKCRRTEKAWKPSKYQDCKPYLNCKVYLIAPGAIKCKEPSNKPAYCDISCRDYNEFEATTLQRYACLDETFENTLPHCAKLYTDVALIEKPQ